MIELIDTPLNGLKIIKINQFCDERGIFHKFFSKNDFENLGLNGEFKEAYYSINKKKCASWNAFSNPASRACKASVCKQW